MTRRAIPLRERPVDVLLIAFFLVNLLYVVPFVDLVLLFPANPSRAGAWPPRFATALLDWWGRTAEPAALERPAWWMAVIAIDAFLFGPFRAAAAWAYATGREGIRMPSIVYASMQITTLIVILADDAFGRVRARNMSAAVLGNVAWIAFPLLILARMRSDHPFTREERAS